MPSDGSESVAANAPLHHLHNIGKNAANYDNFNKTDKLKVTVGVKGIKFVSVEQNGKVVNISTAFGVGAVALYSVDKEEYSDNTYNSVNSMSEETNAEIDDSLEKLRNECINLLTFKYR